jgi:hypothetical protein
MASDYTEYLEHLNENSRDAVVSSEPWRIQRSVAGWDVVAVVDNEVVDIATCHTREMALYLTGLRNIGRGGSQYGE